MKHIDVTKVSVSLPTKDGGKVILVNMLGVSTSTSADIFHRNVFRVGASGEAVWQIGKYDAFLISTFTNIYYDSEGQLKGYNFNGVEYLIDLATGSVKPEQLLR